MRANAKLAKGRFTGDPSFEFEHTEIKRTGEGEEAVEEEEMVHKIIIIKSCSDSLHVCHFLYTAILLHNKNVDRHS